MYLLLWQVSVFISQTDSDLDQLEVVAVSLDHLVFEFVLGIGWEVDSSWVLSILHMVKTELKNK
jgi:hypothetical protein